MDTSRVVSQNHHNCTVKMQRFKEHVEALEAERRKIQVFQREFPLSLELVTQAIEKCKQTQRIHGPVLEEFIPSERTSDCRDDDEGKDHKLKKNNGNKENNEKPLRKSDWLKSAQLWNQTPDRLVQEDSPRKVSLIEVNRNGSGAFHPSERENSVVATPTTANKSHSSLLPASSTAESGGCNGGGISKKEEKGKQCKRKERRSWSLELHRQFLQALQQLGGPHVATPKQIRELMKVDGLTNNEVKSHLQKYRFHTRTPTPIIHSNSNPQFVVVRAIWVPEYEVDATPPPPPPPVSLAAPPPPPLPLAAASETRTQQHNQEDVAHSNSPVSSSPTDTTTASPAA